MQQTDVFVTPWPDTAVPSEQIIRDCLGDENLKPYRWSNGPHDIYGAHEHPYNKVIYVVSGSITFRLPETGTQLTLFEGDRLDLPQGTVHSAEVGPKGVVCLEAHR